jgi:hypothetical protein
MLYSKLDKFILYNMNTFLKIIKALRICPSALSLDFLKGFFTFSHFRPKSTFTQDPDPKFLLNLKRIKAYFFWTVFKLNNSFSAYDRVTNTEWLSSVS